MDVHFIWWGPFNEDACEAVKAFTNLRLGHAFHFWCRSTVEQAQFKSELPKRITVRAPGDGFTGLHTDWKQVLKASPQGVLQTLDGFQTFAAAKDLLSLMVLYECGGLYLDTSCRLLSSFERGWYRAEDFDRSMAAVAHDNVFRVPVLHDQADWRHQPLLFTHTAIVMGMDYMGASPMDGELPHSTTVKPIDVWAMYGKKKDPMIGEMIRSYIFRATKVGLSDDYVKTKDTADIRSAFTNAISPMPSDERAKKRRQDDRTFRNSVAGGLIVRSVYDGLFSGNALASLNGSPWRTVAHTTAEADPNGKYYVLPAVSVLKTYGNSWR